KSWATKLFPLPMPPTMPMTGLPANTAEHCNGDATDGGPTIRSLARLAATRPSARGGGVGIWTNPAAPGGVRRARAFLLLARPRVGPSDRKFLAKILEL